MIRLNRTAHDDQPRDHLNRHKTWITVNGHTFASRLSTSSTSPSMSSMPTRPCSKPSGARPICAGWPATSATRRASSTTSSAVLADAADAGQDITVTVHADSTHGEVIVQAIHWMQQHTVPVDDGRRPG